MLPCPSTSTTSAPSAPRSTSCSAAPAMKSATTASTAVPHPSIMIPVCPVATNRVRTPRRVELIDKLQLCRHLADVAVGPDGQHHQRLDVARQSRRHRYVARRAARIGDGAPVQPGRFGELRIIVEEGVQAADDVASRLGARAAATHATRPAAGRPAERCRSARPLAPSASPSSTEPTTGIAPPNPSTDCAVSPTRWRSSTATTRAGW